jgi:hypothetical protein
MYLPGASPSSGISSRNAHAAVCAFFSEISPSFKLRSLSYSALTSARESSSTKARSTLRKGLGTSFVGPARPVGRRQKCHGVLELFLQQFRLSPGAHVKEVLEDGTDDDSAERGGGGDQGGVHASIVGCKSIPCVVRAVSTRR